MKFYNRALSDAEVFQQKFMIGVGAVNSNLVGYWQFNATDSGFWNGFTHRTDSIHNGGSFVATGTVLAVQKPIIKSFGVYPNPNNGIFTMKVEGENKMPVLILNLQGLVVFNQFVDVKNGAVIVSAPDLKPGIYIVETNGVLKKFVVE